jgi:large subunit ribosomal protein L29
MKAEEIRALSNDEIMNRLDEAHEEMLNLRFQHGVGQLANPSRMRIVRKDMARLKTILRERELWEEYQEWLQQQGWSEEVNGA